eukprot:gene15149-20406_t
MLGTMLRIAAFLLFIVTVHPFIVERTTAGKSHSLSEIRTSAIAESNDLKWKLSPIAFSLLPLSPLTRRKTIIETIVKDEVWTLDQIQGIINVNVPVRSTIIKLDSYGLLIYNPVAPTKECLLLINELIKKHGPVTQIVLGTLGLEHKAFVGSFSRYFPEATVWVHPGQWSFPLNNIPLSIYGFPSNNKKLKVIPNKNDNHNEELPWKGILDYAMLEPLKFKSVGAFGETAFYHIKSKTLIVTDIIVSLNNPIIPPIINENPTSILFHSKDDMLDEVIDTQENRLKGWKRMILFGLYFIPSGIRIKGVFETFSLLPKVSKESAKYGEGVIPISGGLYPWSWIKSEKNNFEKLQKNRLFVAPILRELILNREPEKVLEFVDKVSSWPIKRVIPGHLNNNIIINNNQEFYKAFDFLRNKDNINNNNNILESIKSIFSASQSPKLVDELDENDLKLMQTISKLLTQIGIVAPPKI